MYNKIIYLCSASEITCTAEERQGTAEASLKQKRKLLERGAFFCTVNHITDYVSNMLNMINTMTKFLAYANNRIKPKVIGTMSRVNYCFSL